MDSVHGSLSEANDDRDQRMREILLERAELFDFQRGELIFRAGDEADNIALLVDGIAKVKVSNAEGDEMVVDFIHGGEVVGEMGLFSERARRSASLVALAPMQVAMVPYAVISRLAEESRWMERALAERMAARLRLSNERMWVMTRKGFADRLRWLLSKLGKTPSAEAAEGGYFVPVGRADLASYVGCDLEDGRHYLELLEREGTIQVAEGGVIVSEALVNLPPAR